MRDRVILVGSLALLLAGAVAGAATYAAWDTRRDARIAQEAREALERVSSEREEARVRAAIAEGEREVMRARMTADSLAWEVERARLRVSAERARVVSDSIVGAIVAEFPGAEAMIRELEASHAEEVSAERRLRESAEAEVSILRGARDADARLIAALRVEVATADTRADALVVEATAARMASASRAPWHTTWSPVTILVVLAALLR